MIDLCHGTDFVVIYRIMRTTAGGLKQKYINKETENLHAILEKKCMGVPSWYRSV